jgi:hypothetical protein
MLLAKILSIQSLNILALLLYCYLGSVRGGSSVLNIPALTTISMGIFVLTSLFLIYKNYKTVFEAIVSSLKTRLLVSLVVLATLLTGTTIFIVPMLFALTAIGKDLKTLLKYYLLWAIFILVSIILLQGFGIIATGDMIQYTDEGAPVIAKSLGFNNPNGVFTYLFSILVTGYVLLYKSPKKILFTATALASVIVIYNVTLSRTGLICCLLLILFAHLGKSVPWKKLKNSLPVLFIILTLGSVYLAIQHGQMGDTVNDLLSNRPYWWNMRIEDGALFNLLGNADSFITNHSLGQDRAPFDSFFLRIWFRSGLLILILYFIFFRIWSKNVSHSMLVFGALVALIYGFSEYGVMSNPGRNIILLLIMVPVFSKYMTVQTLNLLAGTNHVK